MVYKTLVGIAIAGAIAITSTSAIAGNPQDFPTVQQNVVVFATERTIFGFDFDQDDVKQSDIDAFKSEVVKLGQELAENPNWTLRIEGHTDETGTESYNVGLSSRRINDLAALLKSGGAAETQLQRVPYGEVNPLVNGHSDAAWASNRRIVARLFIAE